VNELAHQVDFVGLGAGNGAMEIARGELAVAELRGLEAGRAALGALVEDDKLAAYPFFWAARADIERRAGRPTEARPLYERAISLSRSRAEREAYQRRLDRLGL